MDQNFPTDYKSILRKIDSIDPIQYGKTRNCINGAVTYLSPYISRGVISTRQVLKAVLDKGYKLSQIESFVKELCWRDYFQRVAQMKDVNMDIKYPQHDVLNEGIPSQVLQANTGIVGVDNAIQQLYTNGYMHNHCRMYKAAMVCNVAKSHWRQPAQWMYYHLLDGDWASNACSWQWVAGANSSKKYYANQENINKYTQTNQILTYLDKSYEEIVKMAVPDVLSNTEKFVPEINLPASSSLIINEALPTCIYNYYNLDPAWHSREQANRILLLDPDFFTQYPISNNCMDFMMALSKNIQGMQVYIGTFQSLIDKYHIEKCYYKEHPLNSGYNGVEESRDWIAADVVGYYPSFFNYWKKIEKQLSNFT